MILTNKQSQGLKIAVDRYRSKEVYTCIAGFAGTGKTTLVKFIIAALDIDPELVAYVAFTGKASLVLKERGCYGATTAHKLLYKSVPRQDGTFMHFPRAELVKNYSLIVVDEISMLPNDLWKLLLTHKIPVLAMGDPFQLPQIGESNGVLDNPHIFLDEVMRQAQESEIIRLTMDIRKGKGLSLYRGSEIQIISKADIVSGLYLWPDQIIVAKNNTRRNINSIVRKLVHDVDDPAPINGDKVICLRNDWQCINSNGDVLINGLVGTLSNVSI